MNLKLQNKKVSGSAIKQWAALAAAREKIGKIDESLILVSFFDEALPHFIENQ